jgi:hypothetical protein
VVKKNMGYNGFEIGHRLVMTLCEAQNTCDIDDAVRVLNEGYAVLRQQLEVRESIENGRRL